MPAGSGLRRLISKRDIPKRAGLENDGIDSLCTFYPSSFIILNNRSPSLKDFQTGILQMKKADSISALHFSAAGQDLNL